MKTEKSGDRKRGWYCIVVGGQYGSVGKGKVCQWLQKIVVNPHVVRVGGPNSGHTVYYRKLKYETPAIEREGKISYNSSLIQELPGPDPSGKYKTDSIALKQLPACALNLDANMYLAAGSAVNPKILLEECKRVEELTGQSIKSRLIIDPRSVIISDDIRSYEDLLKESIGSTGSGTGEAFMSRALRVPGKCVLVGQLEFLKKVASGEEWEIKKAIPVGLDQLTTLEIFNLAELIKEAGFFEILDYCRVQEVAPLLHTGYREAGANIIVEGTQGFGLSIYHGDRWPYVTARDTTASGFAAEAGIPPNMVDDVIMVVRSWPIRVGGNSGPFTTDEIDWKEVQESCGAPEEEVELTSVTKKVRRVAYFDESYIRKAALYNGATAMVFLGVDRLNHANRNVEGWEKITQDCKEVIQSLVASSGVGVIALGTGPEMIFGMPGVVQGLKQKRDDELGQVPLDLGGFGEP